jgi:hypothetical protein
MDALLEVATNCINLDGRDAGRGAANSGVAAMT